MDQILIHLLKPTYISFYVGKIIWDCFCCLCCYSSFTSGRWISIIVLSSARDSYWWLCNSLMSLRWVVPHLRQWRRSLFSEWKRSWSYVLWMTQWKWWWRVVWLSYWHCCVRRQVRRGKWCSRSMPIATHLSVADVTTGCKDGNLVPTAN